MTTVHIKVQGMDSLKASMGNLYTVLTDTTLPNVAGIIVRNQIVINASSGFGSHSGGFPNVQSGQLSNPGNWNLKVSPMRAEIGVSGPPSQYAGYVEEGHSQTPGRFVWAIRKRLVASFVKAYPYVAPALISTIAPIESKIKKIIEKAFRGNI